MRRRFGRHRNKRVIILLALPFIIALVVIADIRIRPIVRAYAENEVNRLCYESINVAADRAVEMSGITYDDIVRVERSGDNSISAVMADIAAVNKIKTCVTSELLSALEGVENEKIRVPIGSAVGSSLLTGRGPDVGVRVRLTGSSEVEISSRLESVGINQTRHSIVMDIRCIVYVVLLGRQTVSEITLSVPIAETIIIGTVPETYLSLS